MSFVETKFNLLNPLKSIDLKKVEFISELIQNTKGNIFILGVGKNSSLAHHIADTLKSVSVKAFYFSTMNCNHGDIGVLEKEDLIIYLSKSANTDELFKIAPFIKLKNIKSVLISCNSNTILKNYIDFHISLNQIEESTFLIPTNSIILFIYFFNLVIDLLVKNKNLTIEQYSLNHSSGNIGFVLNNCLKDIMIKDNLPIISKNLKIIDVIFEMSKFKYTIVFYFKGDKFIGIFTDGDLRRTISNDRNNLDQTIENFINKDYFSLQSNLKLIDLDIKNLLDNDLLSGIPILNKNNNLEGFINKDSLIRNNISLNI